jgi:hypothetical protein
MGVRVFTMTMCIRPILNIHAKYGGGGGGIGFRIVGFHRKNCPDFGSGECFTRISDLINTADCGFI